MYNFFNYLSLTKPKIMLLVVISGVVSLFFVQLNNSVTYLDSLLLILGIYFTGGAANSLNQCFEYQIDIKMSRTSSKRSIPQGLVSYKQGIIFSILMSIIGLSIFLFLFNFYSFLLALFTILFYSFFYTLYLKPNTKYNIVIGGIAGSMPPIIIWSAVENSIYDPMPWFIFLLIFLWTPPHFWALSIFYKDDYEKIGMPMYPVVHGIKKTTVEIFKYSIVLFLFSFTILFFEKYSFLIYIYFFFALILGLIFIYKSYNLMKTNSIKLSKNLFLYSIIYLFSLFFIMIFNVLLIF